MSGILHLTTIKLNVDPTNIAHDCSAILDTTTCKLLQLVNHGIGVSASLTLFIVHSPLNSFLHIRTAIHRKIFSPVKKVWKAFLSLLSFVERSKCSEQQYKGGRLVG